MTIILAERCPPSPVHDRHGESTTTSVGTVHTSAEHTLEGVFMTVGKVVVWLIVGALAGTLAGRLVTFTRIGFGFLTNLGVGMVGALVGGALFRLFNINLGLG